MQLFMSTNRFPNSNQRLQSQFDAFTASSQKTIPEILERSTKWNYGTARPLDDNENQVVPIFIFLMY